MPDINYGTFTHPDGEPRFQLPLSRKEAHLGMKVIIHMPINDPKWLYSAKQTNYHLWHGRTITIKRITDDFHPSQIRDPGFFIVTGEETGSVAFPCNYLFAILAHKPSVASGRRYKLVTKRGGGRSWYETEEI